MTDKEALQRLGSDHFAALRELGAAQKQLTAETQRADREHAAWEADRMVAELATGREFDMAMKFAPLQVERDALAARADKAEKERDKDLAEMRRFQGMVIGLTHEKNALAAHAECCQNDSKILAEKLIAQANELTVRAAHCERLRDALEILAWMEETLGECSWSKKSWSVIAGRPDIVCLKPGKQIGGHVTYSTMLEALRAAKKASGK